MKKIALLFGFVFCVTFAANAQLKVQNGSLSFNVPDNFQSYVPGANVNPRVAFNAAAYLFTNSSKNGEFYLVPSSASGCTMDPAKAGIIFLAGVDETGTLGIGFHDVYMGNLYNSSDARAKTNIRPMSSATNTILRLNPVTYNFLSRSNDKSTRRVSGSDGTETGFLAQEVAEVLPNAVKITKDDQYLVNYISIIPVLVKAVQEQNARIETLKAEVEALKNR